MNALIFVRLNAARLLQDPSIHIFCWGEEQRHWTHHEADGCCSQIINKTAIVEMMLVSKVSESRRYRTRRKCEGFCRLNPGSESRSAQPGQQLLILLHRKVRGKGRKNIGGGGSVSADVGGSLTSVCVETGKSLETVVQSVFDWRSAHTCV